MEWWAGWWNSFARLFGYDEWAWGSAADWFAAIGTVGAFAFSFFLLQREIDSKRSKHADALISDAAFVHLALEKKWKVVVDIFNSGTHAILDGGVYAQGEHEPQLLAVFGDRKNFRHNLPVGASQHLPVDIDGNPNDRKLFIEFTDVTGRKWYRSLDDGRYISHRKYNRVYWRTWIGEPNKRKIRQKHRGEVIQPTTSADLPEAEAPERSDRAGEQPSTADGSAGKDVILR